MIYLYCACSPNFGHKLCSLGAFWTEFWYMNFAPFVSGFVGVYGATKSKIKFIFVVCESNFAIWRKLTFLTAYVTHSINSIN